MLDQRSSIECEAHAYLDRAVLGLLLDIDKQRPWSEAEIAREISTPGHVPASLKRLRTAGLIHRWNDLVTASRAAVRLTPCVAASSISFGRHEPVRYTPERIASTRCTTMAS